MTIFHKNENFRRINAKTNKLLKNIYPNIPAKFESDWYSLYRVIAKKKIDNLHTQTHTHTYTHTRTHSHTHTHIHTFSSDDFFFNVDYIYAKKKKSRFDN